MKITPALCFLGLAACAAKSLPPPEPTVSAPTAVSAPPPASDPPTAGPARIATALDTPFHVRLTDGSTYEAPEGCFTEGLPLWSVMVGLDPHHACTYDMEDGFSLSMDLLVGSDGTTGPLPAPGQTFDVSVSLPGRATVDAHVRVLRHERPYVVVAISTASAAALPTQVTEFGGVMRILLRDDQASSALPSSWVP